MYPIVVALRVASRVAVVLVATMPASLAAAEDRPFHLEANLGQAFVDEIDGFPIDDSGSAYRLGTGYSFLDWLGVAAAFVDLGTVDASIATGSAGASLPVEASADGFEVTLFARWPVTDVLGVTANLGMLWWTSDSRIAGATDSDSGSDGTWGVGAEYTFRPAVAVTAGWRRYAIEDVDADAVWLGLVVRFGDTE